jgi:hypothetical protein
MAGQSAPAGQDPHQLITAQCGRTRPTTSPYRADNRWVRFEVRPLTADTWRDLEDLFGQPGGGIVRGCWCMYYRLTGADARARSKEQNKVALYSLATSARPPGLVGYAEDRPVGWISLGPRADYRRLARSPIMKPVDDADVWSIVCAYVLKTERGKGNPASDVGMRDRLRPRTGRAASRGVSDRQGRAEPSGLHVLRLKKPV